MILCHGWSFDETQTSMTLRNRSHLMRLCCSCQRRVSGFPDQNEGAARNLGTLVYIEVRKWRVLSCALFFFFPSMLWARFVCFLARGPALAEQALRAVIRALFFLRFSFHRCLRFLLAHALKCLSTAGLDVCSLCSSSRKCWLKKRRIGTPTRKSAWSAWPNWARCSRGLRLCPGSRRTVSVTRLLDWFDYQGCGSGCS